MSDRPFVSVIIVNFNSGARLSRCLDCLEKQTYSKFEIIVMDNNSNDDSLVRARVSDRRARLIRCAENTGFAAANNAAAGKAKGEWLALLNPDAYARPEWLFELIAAAERQPGADAFGSLQLDAMRPGYIDGAGDNCSVYGIVYRGGFGRLLKGAIEDGECFAPCAAAAMYRRSTFLKLGGFDEKFFCYGEDVDFGFRLRNAGGRAIQANNAIVLHEGSGVSGRPSRGRGACACRACRCPRAAAGR